MEATIFNQPLAELSSLQSNFLLSVNNLIKFPFSDRVI